MEKKEEPMVLRFGKFKGNFTMEQLMFHPIGYEWLVWVRRGGLDEKQFSAFRKRAGLLLEKGENRKVVFRCRAEGCGAIAQYASVSGCDQFGYSISSAFVWCGKRECLSQIIPESYLLLPLKFFSVLSFRHNLDRRIFIELLKTSFGLGGKLSRQRLYKFFWKEEFLPEPPPPKEKLPQKGEQMALHL